MLLVMENHLESKVPVKTTMFCCSSLKLPVVNSSLLFLNCLQAPQSGLEVSHLEGWDREDGRETQEGGDMGIYVYV